MVEPSPAPRTARIFHLVKGLGRGGAEGLLSAGLRQADRSRFTYAYGYFLRHKSSLVEELRSLGAPVTCFAARNPVAILLSAARVARALRRWEADLIHCHLPLSGVAGRLAGRLAGVPVVYTEHMLLERYNPLSRWADLATWKLQDQVVAVSREVADSIRRHVRRPGPRVRVVPNGVDLEAFQPDPSMRDRTRARLDLPPGALVVGTVAVFRPQKRLDHWLEAAAKVSRHYPDLHLLVVGDGPLRGELEALAGSLGLAPRTRFVGLQQEVRPFLAAMDVFLMSSDYEGLPVALLEAMAMELPVVATAVGGIPEAVAEGASGLLVPPGDPDRLAEALSIPLRGSAIRQSLGRAARRSVGEGFSIARMVRELEALYLEALEARHPAGSEPGHG